MPIAPNGRIARTSDGMEDMDAFFAGNPASIPPLQRAKRYSQILEEEEEYDDVYEAEDQTANYGKRGRGSNATARGVASVEDEEYDDDENKVVQDDEREQSYEESDYSRSNVTGVSSLHRGRRQSVRSDAYNDEASVMERDQYDIYAEDDGGTRTMSLEGSKPALLFVPQLGLTLSTPHRRLILQQKQPHHRCHTTHIPKQKPSVDKIRHIWYRAVTIKSAALLSVNIRNPTASSLCCRIDF